jgi:hypothetical protein
MNEEQWALVQAALNMEARPRDPALKFQARMDCYLKIWRIMFPARLYPDLVEPTSPCKLYCLSSGNLFPQKNLLTRN